jgi:hypothetical protein
VVTKQLDERPAILDFNGARPAVYWQRDRRAGDLSNLGLGLCDRRLFAKGYRDREPCASTFQKPPPGDLAHNPT